MIEIVDERGDPLPFLSDEPDVQYTKQFGGAWFVRLIDEGGSKAALLSNHLEPLVLRPVNNQSNLWHMPKEDNKKKQYQDTLGASGRLRIGLIDDKNRKIPDVEEKILEIFPGNISVKQLSQMVEEIGLLVLSTTSRTMGDMVSISLGEGQGLQAVGQQWQMRDRVLITSEAIQQIIRVLQREIPRLKARPLRTITAHICPTRIDKVLSRASVTQRLLTNSNKRTVIALTRIESLDCIENQFVFSVLHRLKTLIPYIKKKLEEELCLIPLYPYNNNSEFSRRVQTAQSRLKTENEELLRLRKRVIQELEEGLQWVNKEKKDTFWSEVSFVTSPRYSLRLTGSPAYASVFVQFQKLWGNTGANLEQVYSLLLSLQQGNVRPVWEIYELWCFINLYYALILEIHGLHPVGSDLVQQIQVKNGELCLPRDTPFVLEGKLPDNSPIRFRLWYEPELQNRGRERRTPDILVELKINERKMFFVFDSKYRNYKEQSETTLVDDVYGVARVKYLESGLRFKNSEQELNIRASFIIHTSDDIDYWGEVPMWQLVREHFGVKAASRSYSVAKNDGIMPLKPSDFASHKYGAISLCIDNSRKPSHQFRRLIYLLLYYFARELSYCPHCGVKAEFAVDRYDNRGQGQYYFCPNCGRFWVEHFCCGSGHHLIIKLGEDSFHHPTDPDGRWVYKCPECGAELPSRD